MAITFKEKLKSIFKLDRKTFSALLSQIHSGYLKDEGWFNSFNQCIPLDKNGEPIPWTTYPYIDFIGQRLNNRLRLFEFGSGNSSLYYAKYVGEVVSVEHNLEWFHKIKKKIPGNVSINYKEFEENGEYSRISSFSNQLFHIIIIDGLDRNNCIYNSKVNLTDDGVMILDDSEREEYQEAIQFLRSSEFKQIDFWGIAPCVLFKKCTSIFYREKNCLGI